MTVRLTGIAADDLTEARECYRAIDTDLEQRFLDHLDIAMERLALFPDGAPPVDGSPGVRRARLRRFPYGIFYRREKDDILILRVLHTRRGTAG